MLGSHSSTYPRYKHKQTATGHKFRHSGVEKGLQSLAPVEYLALRVCLDRAPQALCESGDDLRVGGGWDLVLVLFLRIVRGFAERSGAGFAKLILP